MKLILAVLCKEDKYDTIEALNKNGFFVTELATTGGFLKHKNTTLLIGIENDQTDEDLQILKEQASHRKTVKYTSTHLESGNICPAANCAVPVTVEMGGCTVFVLSMETLAKF